MKSFFSPREPEELSFFVLVMRVFLPFAFCYVLSFLLRSTPAVLADDITADIALSASQLGFYASVFYLFMAMSQIPVGIALDVAGPRKTLIVMTSFAGIGAILTFFAYNYETLVLSRLIMGTGMAGSMMGTLKAVKDWFPKDKVVLFSGFTGAAGSLGAIIATAPLEFLNQWLPWRVIFLLFAAMLYFSAASIYTVVPRRGSSMRKHGWSWSFVSNQFHEFMHVIKHPLVLFLIPTSSLVVGATMSLQTLWAGPWLIYVDGHDEYVAAWILLLISLMQMTSMMIIGPIRSITRRMGLSVFSVSGVFLPLIIISYGALLLIDTPVPLFVWVAFGFSMGFGTTAFAIIGEEMPTRFLGRALTTVNFFIFFSVFVTQWAMGLIADLWQRDAFGNYPPQAYHAAIGLGFASVLIASTWFFSNLWLRRLSIFNPTSENKKA